MIALELKNAKFARKKREFYKNPQESGLNLLLKNGEILTILGPNGIGKTTLIKLCLGFLKWQSGTCEIYGKNIENYAQKELFKRISYIQQAKNFRISLNVVDMVLLGLNHEVKFRPKSGDIERAKELLNRLKIYHLKDEMCSNLSGGELQMVIFARALIKEPEFIILDEPESNLDIKNQVMVIDTLLRLKSENKAILINTHYPQNAKIISDVALLLRGDDYKFGPNLINKKTLAWTFDVDERYFDYV